MNAFIAAEAHILPTTQKAVVNVIGLSGIAKKLKGIRKIYMDNRYSASLLFFSFTREVQDSCMWYSEN